MSDLSELYQEVILDHNKNPRNFGVLQSHSHHSEGFNPLCGDRFTIYLKLENDKVVDISFAGSGCAISKSSASLMTTLVKGKTIPEINKMVEEFQSLVTANMEQDLDLSKLGKLSVFSGIREFPARIKCASLPWHTLKAAAEGEKNSVSTE